MKVDEAIFYLKTDREQKIDAMSSAEVAKKTCTVIAYDMGIEALEKQIPKKPVLDVIFPSGLKWYFCPTCGKNGIVGINKHCSDCGQALDWSDTE